MAGTGSIVMILEEVEEIGSLQTIVTVLEMVEGIDFLRNLVTVLEKVVGIDFLRIHVTVLEKVEGIDYLRILVILKVEDEIGFLETAAIAAALMIAEDMYFHQITGFVVLKMVVGTVEVAAENDSSSSVVVA